MTSNKTKPEYIDKLPENVYKITSYDTFPIAIFDRYWWDPTENRIIMKPKRIKKYKIIHPMFDKFHDSRFVHMYDINGKQTFVNFDFLEYSYSLGFYLNKMI